MEDKATFICNWYFDLTSQEKQTLSKNWTVARLINYMNEIEITRRANLRQIAVSKAELGAAGDSDCHGDAKIEIRLDIKKREFSGEHKFMISSLMCQNKLEPIINKHYDAVKQLHLLKCTNTQKIKASNEQRLILLFDKKNCEFHKFISLLEFSHNSKAEELFMTFCDKLENEPITDITEEVIDDWEMTWEDGK